MPGGTAGADVPAPRRLRVDWGHLLLATVSAGLVLAYLINARSVSLSLNNLLLLQPVAIIALLLYGFVVAQCFRRESAAEAEPDTAAKAEARRGLLRVGCLALAFGGFIAGLEGVGFDVSAWLFTLVALWIGGERRWLVLLLFPLVFAAGVILLFRLMMPYPMTTLVL